MWYTKRIKHPETEHRTRVVYSALRTPDGTVLESRYRHDYNEYIDANGKWYMIDGGLTFLRRSNNGDETMLSLNNDDDHDLIRSKVRWGSYGINGDQPVTYVRVMDMTTKHVQAVYDLLLKTDPSFGYPKHNEMMLLVMQNELLTRIPV